MWSLQPFFSLYHLLLWMKLFWYLFSNFWTERNLWFCSFSRCEFPFIFIQFLQNFEWILFYSFPVLDSWIHDSMTEGKFLVSLNSIQRGARLETNMQLGNWNVVKMLGCSEWYVCWWTDRSLIPLLWLFCFFLVHPKPMNGARKNYSLQLVVKQLLMSDINWSLTAHMLEFL